MKLGRMMYNDKVQVPFEDELNRFIRTEVTENPYLNLFLLRPLDKFCLKLFPLFIIGEAKWDKFLNKLIASYLSNYEQGEVTSEKYNQRDVIR